MNTNERPTVFLYRHDRTEFSIVVPSVCAFLLNERLQNELGGSRGNFKVAYYPINDTYGSVAMLMDETQETQLRSLVEGFCEEFDFSFVDHICHGATEQLVEGLIGLFMPHVADVTELDFIIENLVKTDSVFAAKYEALTEEQRERNKRSSCHRPASILVLDFWLPTLVGSAQEGVLDGRSLDEYMLPPGIKDSADRLDGV